MITLSYELLGLMMIAPMIVIFIMYEILLNKKRKEIARARKANREDFLGLLGDKDKQIKDLEGNVAREFALRKKMEQKKQNPYEKKQNPYEGMTNMEIAKQDDRERKLKLKK